MKIIFISIEGDGLALAYRLAKTGNHDVYTTVMKPFPGSEYLYKNVHVHLKHLDGEVDRLFHLVPKQQIGNLIREIGQKSLIVFDNNGFGRMADRLRIGNKLVVCGGGQIADDLEYKRDFGLELMKKHDIDVPDSQKFSDWTVAMKYAKANPKRWVVKVSGEDLPSSATRVSDSPEHALEIIHEMQGNFQGESFELQEYIDGILVEVEGWFDGKKFLKPLNLTFEKKKSLTGDLGHNLGCATNVVCALEEEAKIGQSILGMSDVLEKGRYVGPISLNCIVATDGKLYGLEWTPRFGYDALFTLLNGVYGDYGRFLADFASGRLDRFPISPEDYDVGVNFRYASEDYPDYEPREAPRDSKIQGVVFPRIFQRGLSIGGLNSENIRHIWFYDVMGDSVGRPVTAGAHGTLGCAVYTDPNLNVAAEKVYDLLRGLELDGLEYRTDASNDVDRNMKLLGDWIKSPNKIAEAQEKPSLSKESQEVGIITVAEIRDKKAIGLGKGAKEVSSPSTDTHAFRNVAASNPFQSK